MKAILFPGQGSQFVGMGSDFYNKFDLVKKIFKSVDETLNFPLSNIILNGPESELKLTKNKTICLKKVYYFLYLHYLILLYLDSV